MPDPHATQDRAAEIANEIREDAHAIGKLLTECAEALLHGGNRIQDASIQSHFDAMAQVRSVARALDSKLEERIRANSLRWNEVHELRRAGNA